MHYNRSKIECIDAIESATTGLDGFTAYCVGNIIKYVWRAEFKNGKEDYEKAKKYIDMLLEKRYELKGKVENIVSEVELTKRTGGLMGVVDDSWREEMPAQYVGGDCMAK